MLFRFQCLIALFVLAFAGCERQVIQGPVADLTAATSIRTALTSGESAGGEEAAASTGTGWATLRGQFVYDGNPPQMPPYNVTKEPEICAPGGHAHAQEKLVVDPASKGIQNVAVFVRDAPRVHESAGPRTEPVIFDQKDCVFLTHVLGVTVGESMEIK